MNGITSNISTIAVGLLIDSLLFILSIYNYFPPPIEAPSNFIVISKINIFYNHIHWNVP